MAYHSRHQKKPRHAALFFRRTLLVLLAAALLAALVFAGIRFLPQLFPVRQPIAKPAEPSAGFTRITVDGAPEVSLLQITPMGEQLKLDYIAPGLDVSELSVVTYSPAQQSAGPVQSYGTDTFETGVCSDGYYVYSAADRICRLYDTNGRKTAEHAIPGTGLVVFVTVSDSGRYILYGDLTDSTICLLDRQSEVVTSIEPIDTNYRMVGTKGDRFYLKDSDSRLFTVDGATGQLDYLNYQGHFSLLSTALCVEPADDGLRLVSSDTGEVRKTVETTKSDEIPLYVDGQQLITYAQRVDSAMLSVYDLANDTVRRLTISIDATSSIAQIVPMADTLYAAVINNTGGAVQLWGCPLSAIEQAAYTDAPEPVAPAQTTTTADTDSTTTTTAQPSSGDTPADTAAKKLLSGVPLIPQMPNYPTGCESVSAVMALRYAGVDISVDTFIDQHLEKSSAFYYEGGVAYGPDPYKYFLGSPRSKNAYGCMAPVMEKAIRSCLPAGKTVENATGKTLPELCAQYIDQDIPVMVWVTIKMLDTYPSASWTLEDGSRYSWPANEHCMLLIGYDSSQYYFCDPYTGKQVSYKRSLSETRYISLGSQALAIR